MNPEYFMNVWVKGEPKLINMSNAFFSIADIFTYVMVLKVNLSLYRPWRPLGLREVEAPTFSDIRFVDGGKVVSPTPRPLFTPRKIPGIHFR
jgi:hypothetical protein